ncbi:MAG: hypothetical protein II740_04985, partial [Lachnospiraceae bacterium]|nr:hypothetical protein [Lachnospiraceae bacterium]
KLSDKKQFLIVWAFIFVCWIPVFLLTFPGVLSYDIISQTTSAIEGITTNHHPVLHTWLIGVFMKFGDACFSSREVGLGFLSLLQMIILSYALARFVLFLKRKGVHILLVIFTALFSALWFTNAVLSVTMIKDTLHAAFFVLFVCHFTDIVTVPSEYCKKKSHLIIFTIISFFMFATRNNGLHIYLFCFGLTALIRLPHIKKIKEYAPLVAVIILPVILFKIYSGPVFQAWGIEQGEVREALCIPIQQLQRVSSLKYEELTEEQREIMRSYIIDCPKWMGYEHDRAYDPFFADPAKGCFYSAYYENTKTDFWKFYLKTGRQYSKTYINAFLSNTLGFWYPGYYCYSYVMYEDYLPEQFNYPLIRRSLWHFEPLDSLYNSLCSDDSWRELPVIRFFFVPGFSLWIMLYSLVLSWKKKGFFSKFFPILLPMIAQFGIMLLCPMSSFRYSWPFYLIIPLVFITIKSEYEAKKDND